MFAQQAQSQALNPESGGSKEYRRRFRMDVPIRFVLGSALRRRRHPPRLLSEHRTCHYKHLLGLAIPDENIVLAMRIELNVEERHKRRGDLTQSEDPIGKEQCETPVQRARKPSTGRREWARIRLKGTRPTSR
jgi:hypothetical protein